MVMHLLGFDYHYSTLYIMESFHTLFAIYAQTERHKRNGQYERKRCYRYNFFQVELLFTKSCFVKPLLFRI